MTGEIINLEKNILLKSRLLIEGCDIENYVTLPNNIQKKKIHLYSHSVFKENQKIPDDIILGDNLSACISRIRFNPNSNLKIIFKENGYHLLDVENKTYTPIKFIPSSIADDEKLDDSNSVGSICSFLGMDLVGIAPSNHCFYYKDENECKFCEIWQTYEQDVEYYKPLKKSEIIKKAVNTVLEKESRIKHIAITSGNVKSYNFTAEYFCAIGSAIKEIQFFNRFQDILGTLMPPDNFELIGKIKNSGFNKIYFPLEVFDKKLFEIVCPGKLKYGYERMLDALEFSIDVFGKGNVYTNFVYGIQSLNAYLDPKSYDPIVENEKSLMAVDKMLERKIIPVFTVYHYAGHNKIGEIRLSVEHTFNFFKKVGEKIADSNLIPKNRESIIFSPLTLSNTIYNDGFMLANLKRCNFNG